MSCTISDDDFEIEQDHIVRYTGERTNLPPTWRMGEAWVRKTYGYEYRETQEYDCWNPYTEEKEEVKTVLDFIGVIHREPGRFIFRKDQHQVIREKDRDYILVVAKKTYGEPEWRILDAIRVSGRFLDDILRFGNQYNWTRQNGSYLEIGVRWTKVESLAPTATFPAEAWELPNLSRRYDWDSVEEYLEDESTTGCPS